MTREEQPECWSYQGQLSKVDQEEEEEEERRGEETSLVIQETEC